MDFPSGKNLKVVFLSVYDIYSAYILVKELYAFMQNYNISYSALKRFELCERWFYYSKIEKAEELNVETKWGRFGNVVHEVLEDASLTKENVEDMVEKKWIDYDMYNTDLSLKEAIDSVYNVLENFDMSTVVEKEMKREFEFESMNFKYIIDAITKDNIIIDWKTATFKQSKVLDFRKQLLFYTWCLFKDKGIRSKKSKIVFCKRLYKEFEFEFTDEEIQQEEERIIKIVRYLKTKKKKEDFKINKTLDFFNGYKHLISRDLELEEKDNIYVRISIYFNYFKVEDLISNDSWKKIELENFSYIPANSYFIIKSMKARGVKNYDPRKILYNNGTFYIGFLDKYIQLLKAYSSKIQIVINDERIHKDDGLLLNYKVADNIVLRDYQLEAVDYICKKKISISEIPTGAGKTFIAAEVINRINKKALFVVDKKILLSQAYDAFKEYFENAEVGLITEGYQNWTKGINIGTIQTISKLLKNNNTEFFSEYNKCHILIIDEAHISKSASYKLLLENSKQLYRIGLTGTPYTDNNESLEIYKFFGFPEFKISKDKLLEDGFLSEHKIEFLKYETSIELEGDYEQVRNLLRNIPERNEVMLKKILKHKDDSRIVIMSDRLEDLIYIRNYLIEKNIKTHMITGNTSNTERDRILKTFKILLASTTIFQKGVNIPDLDVCINYGPGKSKIMSIQSLGRILRKNKDKTSYYYDFEDVGCLKKNSNIRKKNLI